jgi:hypothetical protein
LMQLDVLPKKFENAQTPSPSPSPVLSSVSALNFSYPRII